MAYFRGAELADCYGAAHRSEYGFIASNPTLRGFDRAVALVEGHHSLPMFRKAPYRSDYV
jgi:hypothetical protein